MKEKIRVIILTVLITVLGLATFHVYAAETRGVVLDPKQKSANKSIPNIVDWTHKAYFYPNGLGTKCQVTQDVEIRRAYYIGQVITKSFTVENSGFVAKARVETTVDYMAYVQESKLEY